MTALSHSPLGLLLVQATLIVGLSRLLGLGARRLGQPLVVAEILAGILLGPSCLGAFSPATMHALFPASSLGNLGVVSQVGLVLFMFLVGLELDPRLLRGRGHASVAISHTSILVPFGLGALAAIFLYPRLSSPDVPFTSFVLFLGTAMSITAFPVLARMLTERNLTGTRIGSIAITCAAVDDVTAWCLLAFVVSVAKAKGLAGAALTTVLALGFILAMLLLVRPFLRRLGRRVAGREGLHQNLVALLLILLMCSSLATEAIGIHALFGAFLLGVVLPKEGGLARSLAEKLEDLAVVLFLPLFFAFSGLRTEVGLLATPAAWGITAAIIAIASVGKFGGSALAARLTRHTWRESAAVGVLMNTRGLMELIVLNIGLDLGVLSPELFTMLVIMALVTTVATAPLLSAILGRDAAAWDAAVGVEPPSSAQRTFTVLMCVADGRSGPPMVQMAGRLAGTANRLLALWLMRSTDRSSSHLSPQPEEEGGLLAPLLRRAGELALTVKPLSFVSSDPARDICSVAEAKHTDLILLGLHRPLLSRGVLGGKVYSVMREATSPVAVLVDRGHEQLRRVLVPYLGGAGDRMALELAGRLLESQDCEVTLLTCPRPDDAKWPTPALTGRLADAKVKRVDNVDPVQAVRREAVGYDLVVIASSADWGLEPRPFAIQPEPLISGVQASMLIVRVPRASGVPVDEAEHSNAGAGTMQLS
jgi:Kef-type K+ transport system membrane component KefB